jgi:hypothetical protein
VFGDATAAVASTPAAMSVAKTVSLAFPMVSLLSCRWSSQ